MLNVSKCLQCLQISSRKFLPVSCNATPSDNLNFIAIIIAFLAQRNQLPFANPILMLSLFGPGTLKIQAIQQHYLSPGKEYRCALTSSLAEMLHPQFFFQRRTPTKLCSCGEQYGKRRNNNKNWDKDNIISSEEDQSSSTSKKGKHGKSERIIAFGGAFPRRKLLLFFLSLSVDYWETMKASDLIMCSFWAVSMELAQGGWQTKKMSYKNKN